MRYHELSIDDWRGDTPKRADRATTTDTGSNTGN
jgi:hypothetical protein